jgi:V-type H+-transporting ATPase subunit a
MASLFGYLVILVFYKWLAYDAHTSRNAPSLLIAFINMFLFNYNDPTNQPLYRGQVIIPSILSSVTLSFLKIFLSCASHFLVG